MVLPTGQVLSTDFSAYPEVYTPTGSALASAAPAVSAAPAAVVAGQTYAISGTQFNGLTQGAYFGDDTQAATNYPLVQITNNATGHVFYARTSNHSSKSVAPHAVVSTNFSVPLNIEVGPSKLVVIANGIASAPIAVAVKYAAEAFRPDFNGDGRSDIMWRNSNGDVVTWFMGAGMIMSTADLGTIPASWTIVGSGDFSANGKSDIVWRNANGDGKTDILWRDATGDVNVWLMNGGKIASSFDLGVIPKSWTVQAVGDFNADGKADIVWRNSDGDVNIWLMNGAAITSSTDLGVIPTSWTISATADFDGDGKFDLLWRNTNGDVNIWFMNGGAITSSSDLGVIPSAYTIAGTGEFNGDGKADIIWRSNTGDAIIWFMNGSKITSTTDLGVVPTSWTMVQ